MNRLCAAGQKLLEVFRIEHYSQKRRENQRFLAMMKRVWPCCSPGCGISGIRNLCPGEGSSEARDSLDGPSPERSSLKRGLLVSASLDQALEHFNQTA